MNSQGFAFWKHSGAFDVFVGVCEYIYIYIYIYICIASLFACRSHFCQNPVQINDFLLFWRLQGSPPLWGPGLSLWCLLAMYMCTGTCTCPERCQNANPCEFIRFRPLRLSEHKATERRQNANPCEFSRIRPLRPSKHKASERF